MGRAIRTLEDAARYRMLVAATCVDCKHVRKFMATDLAGMYGRHRKPQELHFTCSPCGSKKISVTLEKWGDIRQSEIVVWKPVKVWVPRE